MTKLNLIAGSIVTIGFMSACTMSDHETAPSHSVSVEAEKNALEAEQAELELAKLAELQKQPETKSGKGKSGRKPASTGTATVVKAEADHGKKKKADKKADAHAATETKAVAVKPAEVKHAEKKAPAKVAEKKPEAKAPEAAHEAVAPAHAEAVHESPQAVAKKEIAAGETSVLKAKPAMKLAMNTDPAQQPVTKTLKAHSSHAAAASVYIVQVGAFRVKDNAMKLEEKLKGDGFPVRMREVNHSKNGMLYVVQFEPTPSRDEADAWRSQVKAKASLDAQLVTRPD
jgi:cell division septation protein DedD